MTAHGLLLAAGAGRRMGRPKALVRDDDGTAWLTRSIAVLQEGGCTQVTVVLGAAAEQAEQMLRPALPDVDVVRAEDWESGMGASLRAGLCALETAETDAALVHLVDLPDVGAAVVARVLQAVTPQPAVLARASYHGRPGHPVLLGRDHWAPIADSAEGDRGARDYLATHDPLLVPCDDLASGRDVDRR